MKRFITALMTLVFVLSLVSGLSLTASAVSEKSRDGEHDLVNFALNMPVDATSCYVAPEGFFAPELLVDGQWGTYADGEVRLGWNSDTVGIIHGETDEIDITVTMETYWQLETIVIKPMQWAGGANFPRGYELQVSTNGTTWHTIVTETDKDIRDQCVDSWPVLEYEVDPVVVRYFRIHITHSSFNQDPSGSWISSLGELELWGYKPDTLPEDLDPITYTATFVAGNQIISKVEFPAGATTIEEPEVPAKEGYTGAWQPYTVTDKDFIVRALYTAVETPTEPVTEALTDAPDTEAPATEAPATEPAATDAPATEEPVTEAVTDAPAADTADDEVPEPGVNNGCASVVTLLPALPVFLCGLAVIRRKH